MASFYGQNKKIFGLFGGRDETSTNIVMLYSLDVG